MRPLFLHGLESHTTPDGEPKGRKASFLRDRFGACTPALDTRRAIAVARRCVAATGTWTWPFADYEDTFAEPLLRARAHVADTDVLIGSSFGGAVALRLLHEEPRWTGPTILLAGAGPKLTPWRTLPQGVPVLVVHGRFDDVVPVQDSIDLAATSADAELVLRDDEHSLPGVVSDEALGAWVRRMRGRMEP